MWESGLCAPASPSPYCRGPPRLRPVVKDRNATRKHVWRAQIILLSADGVGANEIMRRMGSAWRGGSDASSVAMNGVQIVPP